MTNFVVCDNADYPASLELYKIYRVLPDEDAAEDGDIRVVDESGEDYLYPASYFIPIEIPKKEYDFSNGVRGKHVKAYREGHSVRIHKDDGTMSVQYFTQEYGAAMLDPEKKKTDRKGHSRRHRPHKDT